MQKSMNIELLTKKDLHEMKEEILSELTNLLKGKTEQKEWLKSSDVRKLLNISSGTLQHLRVTGVLPYTKIGGSIFYAHSDVMEVLRKNKRNAA